MGTSRNGRNTASRVATGNSGKNGREIGEHTTLEGEEWGGKAKREQDSLSYPTCTPAQALCPSFNASLVPVLTTTRTLFLPDIDVAGPEQSPLLGVETPLDFG